MSEKTYFDGLADAHKEIMALHDELTEEHEKLGGFLGLFPKRRHHQIIGASRALTELGFRILNKRRAGDTQEEKL